MKNKLTEELRNEISTYLMEVKSDIENYLAWALGEVERAPDAARAAEVVEDAMHRLTTISYYLATFFEDAEPSSVLMDLTAEVSEEHAEESPYHLGRQLFADPPNRTRH